MCVQRLAMKEVMVDAGEKSGEHQHSDWSKLSFSNVASVVGWESLLNSPHGFYDNPDLSQHCTLQDQKDSSITEETQVISTEQHCRTNRNFEATPTLQDINTTAYFKSGRKTSTTAATFTRTIFGLVIPSKQMNKVLLIQ